MIDQELTTYTKAQERAQETYRKLQALSEDPAKIDIMLEIIQNEATVARLTGHRQTRLNSISRIKELALQI